MATTVLSPVVGAAGSSRKTRKRIANSRLAVVTTQITLVVVFLGAWQWAVDNGTVNPLFVSSPRDVWSAIGEWMKSEEMVTATSATLQAVFLSFVIGSIGGIIVGLLLGSNDFIDRVVNPFLVPINSVPRIALAPLFVAWFGLTMTSKVVLAISIVFFILLENSRSAVKGVDREHLTMGSVVGLNRRQLVTKVVLPSAVPTIFAGLRLAITYSLLGVIASEMIAAKDGLGQQIARFSSEFQIDFVFAVLLELVVVATVLSIVFGRIERWLLRWQQ